MKARMVSGVAGLALKLTTRVLVIGLLLGIAGTAAIAQSRFSDIEGHWAEEQIVDLVRRQGVGGYPDVTFRPDAVLTRAEFVSMLVRACELPAGAGGPTGFADTQGHWVEVSGALGAAVAAGVVVIAEHPGAEFVPDQCITRLEMAVMVVRALGKDAAARDRAGELLPFVDGDAVAASQRGYVAVAVEEGIITGLTGNVFAPSQPATRAQAVVMVERLLETLGQPLTVPASFLTTFPIVGKLGYAVCGRQTSDGGYILGGYCALPGAAATIPGWARVLKVDAYGYEEWTATVGLREAECRDIDETSDGDFICASYNSGGFGLQGARITRLDASGSQEWEVTPPWDYVGSIRATTDGGFIAGGGSGRLSVGKFAADGSLEWQWRSQDARARVQCVRQTADGGYVAVGHYNEGRTWLCTLSGSGQLVWQQELPLDLAEAVEELPGVGFVVGGRRKLDKEGTVACLLGIGRAGEIIWEQAYLEDSLGAELMAMTPAGDGGYMLLLNYGGGNPDFAGSPVLMKVDAEGNSQTARPIDHRYLVADIRLASDGGYVLIGLDSGTMVENFDDTFLLIKTERDGSYRR